MCTIIAKNYIAAARTLCQSFLSFHPDYKCYALIVDDIEGFVKPTDETFEVITLADLEIPDLPSFCFKYGITELCTAAKAHFLEYLLDKKNINKVLYIDPDILITNTLDKLYQTLDVSDILLTPHLDTDYPEDDLYPNDGTILRCGIYNLGFIGINSSENARRFLSWWKPKLYKRCIEDAESGYYVDQKFINLAPLFFDNIFIEKEVGYNVAYWNLHSRRISRSADGWKCNGGPLYFFHFSGYRQEEPDDISGRIVYDYARYHLSDRPDLHQIFSEYKDLLIKNGYEQTKIWPYTYATFKTGQIIPHEVRIIYRDTPKHVEKYGDPFASTELMEYASRLEAQQSQNVNSAQTTVPYKLILMAYKNTPGLRYIYKRWIRPEVAQTNNSG